MKYTLTHIAIWTILWAVIYGVLHFVVQMFI